LKFPWNTRIWLYRITITPINEVNTELTIILDGAVIHETCIPLVDDHQEHQADVKIYRKDGH
jgi:hypothetical protein